MLLYHSAVGNKRRDLVFSVWKKCLVVGDFGTFALFCPVMALEWNASLVG